MTPPYRRRFPVGIVLLALALVGLAGAILLFAVRLSSDRPPAEGAAALPSPAPAGASPASEPSQAPAHAAPGTPTAAHVAETPAMSAAEARVRALLDDLLSLLGTTKWSDADIKRVTELQDRIVALGPAAARPLIERLDRRQDPLSTREQIFHALRRVPGEEVEQRLIEEGKNGQDESIRWMAIESLGRHRSDRAVEALADIARSDATHSGRFLGSTRDPENESIEIPDEAVYTGRMRAVAALAASGHPRAPGAIAEVALGAPDDATRTEAARLLEGYRETQRANEALRAAAASDPSPYVRVQALKTLGPASDPGFVSLIERIAAYDRDAGVRAQARKLLASIPGR